MTGLRPVDDRRAVRVRAGCPQRVARVVKRGASEPGDGWHRAALQYRRIAAAPQHAEVIPERRPEVSGLRNRPLPQSAVAFAGADAVVGGQPARVVRDLGALDVRLRRRRQDRAVATPGRQVLLPRRLLLLAHFTAPDQLKDVYTSINSGGSSAARGSQRLIAATTRDVSARSASTGSAPASRSSLIVERPVATPRQRTSATCAAAASLTESPTEPGSPRVNWTLY